MFDPTQCESVSMAQAKAQEEQNPVNAALRATSIAFVTLAEAGQIDDTTATENVSQFASWAYPVAYAVGNIRQYNGELFRCVRAHTSQADWTPDATASLWKKIGDPTEEWPAWSQPIGAHDAYNSGDKVSHNGKHWTSNIDANVWEPGASGWREAVEEGGVPMWVQPTGAHDAYNKGDQVSHNGDIWISTIDANVWEPSAYGWTKN